MLHGAIGQQSWEPCPDAHHGQEREGLAIDALISIMNLAPPAFGAYWDPTVRMAMAMAEEDRLKATPDGVLVAQGIIGSQISTHGHNRPTINPGCCHPDPNNQGCDKFLPGGPQPCP